jgi:hypothetical protein
MPAIIAALLLAALAAANIEPYNHPASCDACHYDPNVQNPVTFTTRTPQGLTPTSCDPTRQECVWDHVVTTGTTVWQNCASCHTALTSRISGTVHASLQATYGCACHAVAHVGYGDNTNGYVACIYYWVPKLSQAPGYYGQNPAGVLQNVKVCFKGTPGSTNYQITWDSTLPSPPSVNYIMGVALRVGYSAYPNGTVIIYQNQGQLVETDFFSLLTMQFARYENTATISSSHALTEEAPNGETIILGVFDIHDGAFILNVPYWRYGRYPYYVPAGVNPAFAACFNCHFVYQGQPGAAKVMNIGGLWKIGIPADVFNSVTDPHAIVTPQAQAAGAAAPNLALVGLLAAATLLAGGFVAVRRRL